MEQKDRKSERRSLKVYLQVIDRETDQPFGYVVDITEDGVMLTSPQAIEIGLTFQLRLKLSAEIEGSNTFDFSAISRWAGKDSETDFFNTGFQFTDLSEKDADIVEQLIQKFCFAASYDEEGTTESE